VVHALGDVEDCGSMETITPQVSKSNPYLARVYPISSMVLLTVLGMST